MLGASVLDEALTRKNKEVDKVSREMEEMRKSYENKIKNLMTSITSLKSQNTDLESTTKDNIRVNIINKLKEERKDQERVIELLRKLIADEDKVDKFLMKEFVKNGAQRNPTYEEMKIKIKQLEAEIVSLKYKQVQKNKATGFGNTTNNFINEDTAKSRVVEDFKEEVLAYEAKIETLVKENNSLKRTKDKMEKMQNDLFDKLKNYNKEIGEMKSIYDTIKKNMEEENNLKNADLLKKLTNSENENNKHKQKIKEMILFTEQQTKESVDRYKKICSENEIFKKLLETKKSEADGYVQEMAKYSSYFESLDDKKMLANRNELIRANKTNQKMEEQLTNFARSSEISSKQSFYQIESLKREIADKELLLSQKEDEIDLLQDKLQELEAIVVNNYRKSGY